MPSVVVDCGAGTVEIDETVNEEDIRTGDEVDEIEKALFTVDQYRALVEAHPLLGATIQQTDQWVDNNIPDITNLASAIAANEATKTALKEIAASIVILRKGVVKLAIEAVED